MNLIPLLTLILLVIFISTLLRSAFGFGNALIAMPLLVLLLDLKTATPLVALVGIVTALVMLLREWRQLEIREVLSLLLASLAGIPVGLYLLVSLPENIIKGILGLVLILFGVFNLTGITLPKPKRKWLALPFGFFSGILGGAYNANGPPIVIYALLKGWNKEKFRATLQGYFFVTGLVVAAGHGLSGLWSRQVLIFFLASTPVVILGVLAGEKITSRVSGDRFNQILYIFLILLGFLMFI
ncbi:MAG: sulfite exporter TauE/SafE family protein [Anaerolineales bacterium]